MCHRNEIRFHGVFPNWLSYRGNCFFFLLLAWFSVIIGDQSQCVTAIFAVKRVCVCIFRLFISYSLFVLTVLLLLLLYVVVLLSCVCSFALDFVSLLRRYKSWIGEVWLQFMFATLAITCRMPISRIVCYFATKICSRCLCAPHGKVLFYSFFTLAAIHMYS